MCAAIAAARFVSNHSYSGDGKVMEYERGADHCDWLFCRWRFGWSLYMYVELPGAECADGYLRRQNRPDAAVMGYPVVLAGELAHGPSIANLAGENNECLFPQ